MTHGVHERIEQEPEAIRGRVLLMVSAAAILAGLIAVGAELWILDRDGHGIRLPHDPRVPGSTTGVLETSLIEREAAGIALRDEQRRELERASWIDRERGILRIPIGLAIDWTVEELSNAPAKPTPGPPAGQRGGR